ncbi:EscI/YscI/HrpB family type III secretion system inner rod protein [Collimonas humicola]|uniref:EscI/YscI/HrpB family type III secretion system inner rod protein n=1 Tax=Collimonas humicola TaxID=2825886 RepID=UPI001B8B5553|nr:EscI/YscI/HrpB family type III secretion system inner rod protein [Collimonas humicola]
MSQVTSIAANTSMPAAGVEKQPGRLKLELLSAEHGDGAQFRAALERHMQAGSEAVAGARRPGKNNNSLGDKMIARSVDLAGEVKKDQQYVSKMLEQATRTGDSMQLMKAMMALNDYQMRVQFISKTASKATSSLDQLTKLQ